jgi:hypothetical protein
LKKLQIPPRFHIYLVINKFMAVLIWTNYLTSISESVGLQNTDIFGYIGVTLPKESSKEV